MNKLILLLISIVFISCNRSKKESPTGTINSTNSEKNIEQKLNAYCFFELDDKYSEEKDSLVINSWLKEKSLLVLKNDSITNIFDQDGGGLNGSQKNPFTDLYVAIMTPSNESTEMPKLHLNGKLYEEQVYRHSPNLIWYAIKKEFWERELKNIDPAAIEKMYPPDYLKAIKNGEFSPNADLNEGEILEFEIIHKEEKITKFFHATYHE